MHCSSMVEEMIKIPNYFDSHTGTYNFEGCFCSYECAKTWNLESNDSFKNIRFHLLEQYLVSKGIRTDIKFAPHRKDLKIYGGKLEHTDFKNKSISEKFGNERLNNSELNIKTNKQLSILDTMTLIKS